MAVRPRVFFITVSFRGGGGRSRPSAPCGRWHASGRWPPARAGWPGSRARRSPAARLGAGAPAHAPAARCWRRRRRRGRRRRRRHVAASAPPCGCHHRRASPSRRITPRSPSSHISPIVRRRLVAGWPLSRLPSNRPVRSSSNSKISSPASSPAITGFSRRSRARDGTHLAHQEAEGVDEVHRGFAHQELGHLLEVGLAVQVGLRALAVAGAQPEG